MANAGRSWVASATKRKLNAGGMGYKIDLTHSRSTIEPNVEGLAV
jgi:hypothetical protein